MSKARSGAVCLSKNTSKMSKSFVRASKYRHVFGTAAKRDACYDNLKVF
jgi:hypothetical protein